MYIFFGGESLIRLSVLGFRVQDYESSLKVKRGLLRGPGDLVGSKWSYKYPKWSYPNITIKINLHITDLLPEPPSNPKPRRLYRALIDPL